jgi:hypothetical protein
VYKYALVATTICAALLAGSIAASADVAPNTVPVPDAVPNAVPDAASKAAPDAVSNTASNAAPDAVSEAVPSAPAATDPAAESLATDALGKFCMRIPVRALAQAFADFVGATGLAKGLTAMVPAKAEAPSLTQLLSAGLPKDVPIMEATPC